MPNYWRTPNPKFRVGNSLFSSSHFHSESLFRAIVSDSYRSLQKIQKTNREWIALVALSKRVTWVICSWFTLCLSPCFDRFSLLFPFLCPRANHSLQNSDWLLSKSKLLFRSIKHKKSDLLKKQKSEFPTLPKLHILMIVLWCIRKVFANCPTKNIKFLRSLWFFWRNKTLTCMRGAQRFSGIELLKIFRDRQKLVAFRKSQKLLNHSTLLKMYIVYFSKPGNKNWKLNVVVCQRIAHSSLS